MTKQELCKIICQLMGCEECNAMILRQINKYVNEHGWSYKDIARAFAYYVEVQGNTPDPKYGIGIVRFVMDDARKYYETLQKQKEAQIKAANEQKNSEQNKIVITVAPGRDKTIRKRSIDISQL
jgi:hypothetical protein